MIASSFRATRVRLHWVFCGAVLATLCHSTFAYSAGRQYEATSRNFHVSAPDARLAQQVASEAERYRSELSRSWLGYEIEPWSERCPIRVELAMHAGGETSFAFVSDGRSKGKPISWQMKIFGPPDRLLDAVLPHEVTHTIFATHFGRPLPRWADEGACTTVEHQSEKAKNHRMLIDFLSATPSRGIPFNRMYTMKQYPHDILPLYAQGHSVAKFLIMRRGRRSFMDYLEDGMNRQQGDRDARAWDTVTAQYYGFRDLSDLQLAWIDWVKAGSIEQPSMNATLASHTSDATPAKPGQPTEPRVASANLGVGWYARQMASSARADSAAAPDSRRVSTNRHSLSPPREDAAIQPPLKDSRILPTTLWR